MLSHDY